MYIEDDEKENNERSECDDYSSDGFQPIPYSDLDLLEDEINIIQLPSSLVLINTQREDDLFSFYLYFNKDTKIFEVIRQLKVDYTEKDYVKYMKIPLKDRNITYRGIAAQILDYGISLKQSIYTPWIRFEYIPGYSLFECIQYKRQVNFKNKFLILYSIALKINALHLKNKYNTDLRLENIIVTVDYGAVFNDLYFSNYDFSTRDEFEGNLVYLSPVFEGINVSSYNIFSVGVIINLFINQSIEAYEKVSLSYDNYLCDRNIQRTRMESYLEKLELKFVSMDIFDDDNELLKISKSCLLGEISNSEELVRAFENIAVNGYLKKTAKTCKNDFLNLSRNETSFSERKRDMIDEIMMSALNFHPPDIKNSIDYLRKYGDGDQSKITLLIQLYTMFSNDFSYYNEFFHPKEKDEHIGKCHC